MPERSEIANFGAGPATLPDEVVKEAAQVLGDYNGKGLGIIEMSHRSPEANAILANTKSALQKLLSIPESDGPDGYEILFMQGGGSGQFSATVYHMVSIWVQKQWKHLRDYKMIGVEEDVAIAALRDLVEEKMKLDYLVTGSWSLKASQEAARLIGPEKVNVVVDARKHREGGGFGVIPEEAVWKRTEDETDCVMTYYCDNETVDGVEFQRTPAGHNLVGDMSSNFLSRPIDVKRHAAIFGGAQKNIGTTGITIAIISNKFLPPHAEMADPKLLRKLGLPIGPVVLDWPTIAKNNSLYNTLPIFDVWFAGKVMDRLLRVHSSSSSAIVGQEAESNKKAAMLHDVLDSNPDIYSVVPDKSVRSRMNICVRVKAGNAEAEKAFLKGAEAKGLVGLKGHRSVGGVRISNYNAITVEKAEKLRAYLEEFAKEQKA